jgi:hypothetical protein
MAGIMAEFKADDLPGQYKKPDKTDGMIRCIF